VELREQSIESLCPMSIKSLCPVSIKSLCPTSIKSLCPVSIKFLEQSMKSLCPMRARFGSCSRASLSPKRYLCFWNRTGRIPSRKVLGPSEGPCVYPGQGYASLLRPSRASEHPRTLAFGPRSPYQSPSTVTCPVSIGGAVV
jgi:hypothetical protein